MVVDGDRAQIIFERTLKISLFLLQLTTDEEGLAVGERLRGRHRFLGERGGDESFLNCSHGNGFGCGNYG